MEHVRQVLQQLKEEKLLINLKKYTFQHNELVYLRFLISKDGLKMDHKKVKDFLDWRTPQSTFEVRSFHGLEIFYSILIHNFSQICVTLTECMKKGTFKWKTIARKAFADLKKRR